MDGEIQRTMMAIIEHPDTLADKVVDMERDAANMKANAARIPGMAERLAESG